MKKLVARMGLVSMAVATNLMPTGAAYARVADPIPTPVTIDGTIADKDGHLVAGRAIVIWCGDIDHFGGQVSSDAHGHFILHTDSGRCPLGWILSAVVYNEADPWVHDGFARATIHTQTTVNVQLGVPHPIPVPEYGLFGALVSLIVGGGAMAFVRRHPGFRGDGAARG